jgi:putative endonuclease
MPTAAAWFVYLLECRGGRIYTGIATDVDRRLAEHRAGRGARFTRAHPPVRELARIACAGHGEALRSEAAIKRLRPARKRELVERLQAEDECRRGVASPAAPVETVTSMGKLGSPP